MLNLIIPHLKQAAAIKTHNICSRSLHTENAKKSPPQIVHHHQTATRCHCGGGGGGGARLAEILK